MSTSPYTPMIAGLAVESSRRRWLELLAIGVLSLTLNLAGNGRVSLWDRDEPRYAGCVREMRERGDWIHPTFNAEPRYQKPILIYWLMRVGVAWGGDNPFGARLISSFAGAASCLLVWSLGRRMFGPRAGLLAALMLATAPIMVAESKLATIDATLTLVLIGCQYCLWELGRRESRRVAAGFWVLLALATLLKGPVGPALIAAAGVVSGWWGGPAACWKRLHWRWGPALFLALTTPWFIAVGVISNGDFFRVSVGQQVLLRFTTVLEQHGGIPGYYLLTTIAFFHPWSSLLPAALGAAWTRRKLDARFGFLLGWVVGPLLLLECFQTKLFHYYVPAYPACALLIAWLAGALVKEEVNLRRWPLGRTATGLLGGVGIGLTVLLISAAMVVPGLLWVCLTLALVLISGTLFSLQRFMSGATDRAMAGLVVTWAVVMLGVGIWLLPAAEPYKMARIVAGRLAALADRRQAQPVLFTFQEPSIVYEMGRPVPLIRTWENLYHQFARHGQVVSAVLPIELRELQAHPGVDLEIIEPFRGFNLNKGREQNLHIVLIRPNLPDARELAGSTPTTGAFVRR